MTDREPGKRSDIETSRTSLVKLYEDAGITDNTALLWQKVARVPEIFYKAQGAFEKAQEAQELKLRCIRQAGTILLPLGQGGGMTAREQQKGLKQNLPSVDNLITETPFQKTLEQGGISPHTAYVWQKVARVPEDKFEVYFTEADYYKDEFTIAGLLKFAGEWYGRSDSAEWQG